MVRMPPLRIRGGESASPHCVGGREMALLFLIYGEATFVCPLGRRTGGRGGAPATTLGGTG